jgi:hypothetical protein
MSQFKKESKHMFRKKLLAYENMQRKKTGNPPRTSLPPSLKTRVAARKKADMTRKKEEEANLLRQERIRIGNEDIKRLGSVVTRSTMRGLGGPALLTAGLVGLLSARSLTRRKKPRSGVKTSTVTKKPKRVRFAESSRSKKSKKYKKRSRTRNHRRRRKS